MANDADDFMGGGFKTFPFDEVGDRISGTVIEPPVKEQQRSMDTGELAFWDNGQAKWMYRIQLQTDLRDADDQFDEGVRTLYLSWKRLDAVRAAVRASGAKTIEVGGKLAVQFTEFGERTKKGFSLPKIGWKAWYKPPVAETTPDFMDQPAEGKVASPEPTKSGGSTLEALKALKEQQVQRVDAAGEDAFTSKVSAPSHHSTDDIPF